jgi:riboflavin synthase
VATGYPENQHKVAEMFTGIIQHVGRILASREAAGGRRARIDLGPLAEGLRIGASVAVNGLCLTASSVDGAEAEFDIVAESLQRSTLGRLKPGDRVNLEPALASGGRLDGHIVQGHVDGVAKVVSVQRGQPWIPRFAAERSLVDQMVPKGSIAIDGVSLTLVDVEGDEFSVALIPTTLADTTLADLAIGDQVNIEVDILGKYVRRFLQQMLDSGSAASSSGLTLDKLKEAGFL